MELLKYDLDDLAEDFFYGSMPKEEDFCDEGYPVFSGYRIVGYSSKFNIKERTLVVVARGVGGTGDVAIAGEKTFLTNLAIAIPIKNNLANIDYLKYYLNIQGLRYLDSGAAQSQITINNLRHHKVFIPDIHVQNRIANVLATYDNLIEVNNKRIKVLEQMAENLYKEWFVRFRFPGHESVPFENGLPKGWRLIKTNNICKITTGKKDANQADVQGKYPFFSCARENDLYSNDPFLSGEAILISGNGSYTGLTKCYRGIFDLYQRTYALYDINFVSWQYLYWSYKLGFEKEYMGGNHGSAIPYITKPDIEKYKIIVPNEAILNSASRYFEDVYNMCDVLRKENENLIMQRDLLLPRLMSGKLEV